MDKKKINRMKSRQDIPEAEGTEMQGAKGECFCPFAFGSQD